MRGRFNDQDFVRRIQAIGIRSSVGLTTEDQDMVCTVSKDTGVILPLDHRTGLANLNIERKEV